MKNVRFHEAARQEFLDQVSYYEEAQIHLGRRFQNETEPAVKLAASMPFAGSPHKFGTRRVFPKKFPFSVVYAVRQSEVIVLAVAHFNRRPAYRQKRKNDD